MSFQKLTQTTNSEPITCLIYGGAKTGKTFLAGTLQNHVLYISNGMGSKTLRGKEFHELVHPGDAFYIEDVFYDSPKKEQRACQVVGNLIEQALQQDDIHYIVIDDASAMTRSFAIQAIEFNGITGKTASNKRKENTGIAAPEPSDYDMEMQMGSQFFQEVISECKYHNKSLILLAHERNTFKAKKMMDVPELVKTVPLFTSADKSPDRIPGLFDWVIHTKKQMVGSGNRYLVETQGGEHLLAGCRAAERFLPSVIKNANLKTMIECVEQEMNYPVER